MSMAKLNRAKNGDGLVLKAENPASFPPPSLSGAAFADEGGETLLARQIRMAYGLLQNAMEEAAEAAESHNVKFVSELEELQARAIRSIQDSALATLDLFEAIGAAHTPRELAGRQIELARLQRETARRSLGDFFDSAKAIVSMATDPLNRQLNAFSGALATERGPSEPGDSLLARLNKLTARQKKVLELLAEGLPNKVIAHRLGISETTVKAHVGEILRKLKVYNRARAIVMLAQFDMGQIRSLPATDAAENQ